MVAVWDRLSEVEAAFFDQHNGDPLRRLAMGTEDFPGRRRLAAFEGGSLYAAERGGKYYLILDESSMADFLSDEDLVGLQEDLVKILEFDSDQQRQAYILSRGWG